MVALLFPGQGSQAVGMGKAVFEAFEVARRTYAEADDALGLSLSKLCFEGPESELQRTENTQPAILTTSVAIWRALLERQPGLQPAIGAGHSLGEWSALVAAGAIPFADAVKAVRERGRLMQAAVPEGRGAMAAVMGLDPEEISTICRRVSAEAGLGAVEPANFNSSEQTVISGDAAAVERAGVVLGEAGAKRVVPLSVSAPFHCSLMRPAAEGLAVVLETIAVKAPSFPIVTNVEAKPNADGARVKSLLVEQVTSPVRWVESVRAIAASGEKAALEIGTGKVLRGLVRRIDRELKVLAVEDPASIDEAAAAVA